MILPTLTLTRHGLVTSREDEHRLLPVGSDLDTLLSSPSPLSLAATWFDEGETCQSPSPGTILAPIQSQEVWAAGVTYSRSRTARTAESAESGASRFYDLVYEADRPELFFKATPGRVVGPGAAVRIRADSTWDVPEPELTLVISSSGEIVGVTIGNDMSSRSIEGENPLYLPQAKIYSGSAALGPRIVLIEEPPEPDTSITLDISRDGTPAFHGVTRIGEIVRPLTELVDYLFRDNEFPAGVFLMTGTGVVPDDDFTLTAGDVVTISIEGIGTLENRVEVGR